MKKYKSSLKSIDTIKCQTFCLSYLYKTFDTFIIKTFKFETFFGLGARRTGRFDQPPSYVQNFDLTLADPTLGPKNGDTSYIKMNESRVMGNGNGNKIYAPREHQPKSCTGGKIQMSSYQPS